MKTLHNKTDADSNKLLTVNFILLYRAALRSSLGNWELRSQVANYVAS